MKALLVVVGNPFLLSMDVYWKELIQFAINNGILSFLFENVFVHEVILSKNDFEGIHSMLDGKNMLCVKQIFNRIMSK
jgi:hypothetical protein